MADGQGLQESFSIATSARIGRLILCQGDRVILTKIADGRYRLEKASGGSTTISEDTAELLRPTPVAQ